MFGGFSSKLKRWGEAGLISASQSDAILAFEKERKKGKMVRDLTNVGIFAIVLGVLAVVASNWQEIPPVAKIALHAVLNLGVAGFMLRLDGVQYPVRKDASVATLFGLFLTFIALIGQIYQLHGDLHVMLLFWLTICTPFVWFYGRGYSAIVPWLAAAIVAFYVNIGAYLGDQDNRLLFVGSVISFYLPVVLLLIARLPWLEKRRPGFVWSFYNLGLYLPAIFANIAILLFYDSTREVSNPTAQIALLCGGLFLIFILFNPARRGHREGAADLWYYLLISGVFFILPFALPELKSGLLSAVLSIVYWGYLAALGARIQSSTLTDWAIRLIVLRLFIVYLEVFGGMLATGFGLILSGIVLLVVLRFLNQIVAVGRRLVNYEIH